MFRLLGFLVGSMAALTTILFVLGIPDFHLTDREVDEQRFDAAVKKLKEKQQEITYVAKDAIDTAAQTVADVEDKVEVVAQELAPEAPAQTDQLLLHSSDTADERPEKPENLQWYSFWNPFRSEIAARGFVSQLEKVTGLDYRVVKVKTGVYEVAFAYNDDAERRTKLAQISAATGLDLPDS